MRPPTTRLFAALPTGRQAGRVSTGQRRRAGRGLPQSGVALLPPERIDSPARVTAAGAGSPSAVGLPPPPPEAPPMSPLFTLTALLQPAAAPPGPAGVPPVQVQASLDGKGKLRITHTTFAGSNENAITLPDAKG